MDLQLLFNRFNENLNFLRGHKNVRINYVEIAQPADQWVFDKLESMGVYLPDPIIEFYSACNGLTLNWDYSEKEEGFSFYGWMNIVPIEQMFGGLTGDLDDYDNPEKNFGLLYDDFTDDEQVERRRNLCLFENIEGDNAFVCLDYSIPSDPSITYVSDFDNHSVSMPFEKYLGLLIDTMGMEVYRQMAILEENFDQNLFDYEAAKKLQEIFPWFNFDEVQENYFD
jgi:hypothetical protein